MRRERVARFEGEIILTALARRIETIQIGGEPKRRLNNTLRAWDSLPVTVESRERVTNGGY
jgi:4-methoxybenzoate monooxygenase (O-demethylating)